MDINAWRLAKIQREVIESFYSAIGFEPQEVVRFSGECAVDVKCYFCADTACFNHYVPNLQTFSEWIEKHELRKLNQLTFNVVPACVACVERLERSVSTDLKDQFLFINSKFEAKNFRN